MAIRHVRVRMTGNVPHACEQKYKLKRGFKGDAVMHACFIYTHIEQYSKNTK